VIARFNLLPDPRFTTIGAQLRARLDEVARALRPDTLAGLLQPLMRDALRDAFDHVGAHEGTVWLADPAEEFLDPVFNTGPNADRFVGHFRQPMSQGLMTLTFRNQQPQTENEVYRNELQDRTLDTSLGLVTCSMMVVPLQFAGRVRGVISCVQLKRAGTDEPDPPGFGPEHIHRIGRAATVLSILIDHHLTGTLLGLPGMAH
jgi:hypothetical protein